MKFFLSFSLLFCWNLWAAIDAKDLKVEVIEPNVYVVCKANSVVRTIRIEKDLNGCEAKYTKSGEDRVIGFGRSQGSCQPFLDNVKTNLERANWRCKSFKNAKITAALKTSDSVTDSPNHE